MAFDPISTAQVDADRNPVLSEKDSIFALACNRSSAEGSPNTDMLESRVWPFVLP